MPMDSRETVTEISLIDAGKFLTAIITAAKTVNLIIRRLSNVKQLKGIVVMCLKETEILSGLTLHNNPTVAGENGVIFLTGMTTDRRKTIRGK